MDLTLIFIGNWPCSLFYFILLFWNICEEYFISIFHGLDFARLISLKLHFISFATDFNTDVESPIIYEWHSLSIFILILD